jgi:hypothetical protein
MRKISVACAMAVLAVTGALAAERTPMAPAMVQRVLALQPRIGPRTRTVIGQEAARIVTSHFFSLLQIRTDIEEADLGAQGGADIDALVQLTLLQAAVDAEADLRNQIVALQANIAQRKTVRSLTASMRRNERVMKALAAEEYARRGPPSPIAPVYSLDTPGGGLVGLDDRITADQSDLEQPNLTGEALQMHLHIQTNRITQTQFLLSNLLNAAADLTASLANPLK